MFGLRSLVTHFSRVVLRWRHYSDQTSTEVCDRFRLVSRWRIVKSNESFANYWLKHDVMIIRIQVYLSSLLPALMSKFHFAKMLITLFILRNNEDWTRHKMKTIFWLRFRFRVAMPSCFWSRMWRHQKQFSVRVRQNTLHVHVGNRLLLVLIK